MKSPAPLARFARYVPTGHIFYARAESVMAVPFDLARLEVAGQALPVIDNVATDFSNGVAQFSVSDTGALAYLTSDALSRRNRLVWVDRKGAVRPILETVRDYGEPRLAPDETRVAMSFREPDLDV